MARCGTCLTSMSLGRWGESGERSTVTLMTRSALTSYYKKALFYLVVVVVVVRACGRQTAPNRWYPSPCPVDW